MSNVCSSHLLVLCYINAADEADLINLLVKIKCSDLW